MPRRSRAYARRLLSSITRAQRWGFSRHSRRVGFKTFFKGGWRGTGTGQLVHEAALFERRDTRFSMAVLAAAAPRTPMAPRRARSPSGSSARGRRFRLWHLRRRRPAAAEPARPAHRRAGLVDVRRLAPGVRLDIVYAGRNSLTGHRLAGYCEPWALLLDPAARDLARAQRFLRRRGLGLVILDYRPAQAPGRSCAGKRSGPSTATSWARTSPRSAHNAGSAVDATLVRIGDGRRLRMGRYDALGPGAHTLGATGRVLHEIGSASRGPCSASASPATGASGGTSSTASGSRASAALGCEAYPPAIIEQMTEPFRVALAQIDPTVGDIAPTPARSRSAARARDGGAAAISSSNSP